MIEESGQGELPELVRRWIDRFTAGDVEGLVSLYAPGALIDVASEEVRGRQELAYRLRLLGERIKGLQVKAAWAVPSTATLGFETMVGGWLGEARIRHEWVLDGGRIRSHVLQVVDRRRPSPMAA
jgi:hypothetical protein